MKFDIISIFPEFFESPLSCGILRIALEKKLIHISVTNPRNFTNDGIVDDYQFGGGAGMVMKPEPLTKAISHVHKKNSYIIHLTPKGKPLRQTTLKGLSQKQHLILICGRYKGIDERINQMYCPHEISIGDYVLSGGESAALVLLESISRLLPGVLGNRDSAFTDSFEDHLFEAPIYTRPYSFKKRAVPPVLRSGNHNRIKRWRRKESLKKSMDERPDLVTKATFSKGDLAILLEVLNGKNS
jgi:tRNA (guanine37-N1)-methyltransferase